MVYDTHEIKFNVPNLCLSKLQELSWFINTITLRPPIFHPNFYSYATHYFSVLSHRLGIICLNLVSNVLWIKCLGPECGPSSVWHGGTRL